MINESVQSGRLVPLLLTVAAATFSFPAAAAAQKMTPVTSSVADSVRLSYEATRGTWMSVDVHPSGDTLVFDLLGHLYEMPMDGGTARPLTRGTSWNTFPRYSPDGGSIAFTSDRGGWESTWILDRATGQVTPYASSSSTTVRPAWTGDGRAIYATTVDRSLTHRIVLSAPLSAPRTIHSGGFLNTTAGIVHDPLRDRIYFAQSEGDVYATGSVIRSVDRRTGVAEDLIRRPGGAASPALSPDAGRLAYIHRRGLETQLSVRDLRTGQDRVVARDLSRDRQDYDVFLHGAYPNIAWTPDGHEVVYWADGGLRRTVVETGRTRPIEFRAPVQRSVVRADRHPLPVPSGPTSTLLARWPRITGQGVVFEALGDLWLWDDGARPLTRSREHETSPLVDEERNRIFFARWSDEDAGGVWVADYPSLSRPRRITTVPAPYGALALGPSGDVLAALRSDPVAERGRKLENHRRFQLVRIPLDGGPERVLTTLDWSGGGSQGPSVTWGPEGRVLYVTWIEDGALTLGTVKADGHGSPHPVYRFPDARYATLSPDLRWVAFNEYRRSYLVPFLPDAPPTTVQPERGGYPAARIAPGSDGLFLTWHAADTLSWVRGARLLRTTVEGVRNGQRPEEVADLSVSVDPVHAEGIVAYTGARVITMDPGRSVLEDATIVVRDDRIVALGQDVEIPEGARRHDIDGHTVIPGLVDVHAHYRQAGHPLGVMEQRSWALASYLAYGVTTIYEVFGGAEKDPWMRDAVRAGLLDGPRLFTVGPAAYGAYEYARKYFRSLRTEEDAREVVAYNRAFGATAIKDYLNFHRGDRIRLYEAAREAGLNVVAEPGGQAHDNWARVADGVQGLAHGQALGGIQDDVIRLLQAAGTGVTPTLGVKLNGPPGQSLFHARDRLWQDSKLLRFETRESLEAAYRRPILYREDDLFSDELAQTMARLQKAGVQVQTGGHGARPGLDLHWEMELLVQGGMSPMEALEAATIAGARHHGLNGDIGSLTVDRKADFVVLEANPLTNIRNARTIRWVVKNGVLYSGEDGRRIEPRPRADAVLYYLDGGWQ